MNSVSQLHSSAMTNSQRIAKYRRRKKIMDSSYQIAENQRLESQRKMKVKNMSEKELKTYRASVADRQRKYRAKKKQLQLEENKKASNISMIKKAYKSPQSMGKAISKCLKSLPYSPTKKRAVVSGIANTIGLKVQQKMDDTLSEKSEIDSLVEEFFYRSDIVYTMPGMKDEMTIWDNNGIKSRVRKYYLTMFLREAHKIFEETYESISFRKFCSLRPKNVLLLKNSPIDQCKCKLHENFRLKLKALKITYDGEWWKNNLCQCNNNNLNSDCWKGKCLICGNGKLIQFQINPGSIVSWEIWIKNRSSSKIRKTTQSGCSAQLKELILKDLPFFQEHVRIKRIQSNSFEQDKANGNNRVLQIDFAMAYACDYQNEIQSALWSRENVQLFTAALFFKNKCTTFLICSDTKDKGKNSIYAFLMKLYDIIIKNNDLSVNEIIYSDGPSSEFKNKYMTRLLYILSNKFQKNFQWKYFATAHGKGVVDGVGGRVKSLVRMKVMSKSEATNVQNSLDFANVATSLMTSTKVFHMSQVDIESAISSDNPWVNVEDVDGIQQMHVIKCNLQNKKIQLWKTNCSNVIPDIEVNCIATKSNKSTDQKPNISNFNIGDWCAVTYDKNVYAGEISNIFGTDVEVNVMIPSGSYWKWPKKSDVLLYPIENVIKKLSPPIVVGSRGQFKFEKM